MGTSIGKRAAIGLYDFIYRHEVNLWDIGPREELVDVVEDGLVEPGRTIYLGSGTAKNPIFMAERGFDVVGVDFSPEAIHLGRRRAAAAGVDVEFVLDDLTDLRHIRGPFDFLVDFGTLDDLLPGDRERYIQQVVPLARPGSHFFIWCFEWPARWWERRLPFELQLEPGEVERRFGRWFEVERLGETDLGWWFEPRAATYLLTRNDVPFEPSSTAGPA